MFTCNRVFTSVNCMYTNAVIQTDRGFSWISFAPPPFVRSFVVGIFRFQLNVRRCDTLCVVLRTLNEHIVFLRLFQSNKIICCRCQLLLANKQITDLLLCNKSSCGHYHCNEWSIECEWTCTYAVEISETDKSHHRLEYPRAAIVPAFHSHDDNNKKCVLHE